MTALKYAVLFDGELRGIKELSSLSGIRTPVLHKKALSGGLTEAWLRAYMRRQQLLKTARSLGITSDVLHYRRKAWGECERVYTQPKGGPVNASTIVEFRGERRTLREVSGVTGVSKRALLERLRNGLELDAPPMSRHESGGLRHKPSHQAEPSVSGES